MSNKRSDYLIDCPRCLGKGHVDLQDIKRLRRELFWEPGPHCAYCDGKKVVELEFATNINADDWFITSDVNPELLQNQKCNGIYNFNFCESISLLPFL